MRRSQLQSEPLCSLCLKANKITPATVVHHVIAHRGNKEIFYSSPLESRCAPCHNSIEQSKEKGGTKHIVGNDGWSIP